MKGFHAYYLNKKDESKYSYIDYLSQLCSIILWKKNYGHIELICNETFLEEVKKWGLDKFYDNIDTNLYKNIPYEDNLSLYWSFSKIYAIKEISKNNNSFCVIDTDLWFYNPLEFDMSHNFVGYHPEKITNHQSSPYINPKIFSLSRDYDWTQDPINCAFLYFNSNKMIDEWYNECLYIIENTTNKNSFKSSHAIFIEQRLITAICKKLNLNWSTLLENFYLPHAVHDGSEWEPRLGYTQTNLEKFQNIKHIWGLKKMYDDEYIRNLVLTFCKITLDNYYPNWKYTNNNLYQRLKSDITDEEVSEMDNQINISNILENFKNYEKTK